jgi:hypothetical protein
MERDGAKYWSSQAACNWRPLGWSGVQFNGIGDLGEYFVEQSYQAGIRDHGRTWTLTDRGKVANIHCRWEYKRKLPIVLQKIEDMAKASIKKNGWQSMMLQQLYQLAEKWRESRRSKMKKYFWGMLLWWQHPVALMVYI